MHAALRAEHHRRLRAARRTPGRHRRQPAGAPRRHARHRRVGEGRAVRPVLRRVQHSARHLRGRAGVPARHGAGVRRHHPARRQAAVRVCRGDRAEGHRHHAQGLRRRVLRHGEQAHPHRRRTSPGRPPRSRSWARKARSTSSTSGSSRRPPTRRRAAREKVAEYREKFANPYVAAGARLHRRSHPAPRRRARS